MAGPPESLCIAKADHEIGIIPRMVKATGSDSKADVGILLVAHGQPASWDAIYKKQPEQENMFRQETKKLLIKEGYKEHNIELAYYGI